MLMDRCFKYQIVINYNKIECRRYNSYGTPKSRSHSTKTS